MDICSRNIINPERRVIYKYLKERERLNADNRKNRISI